MMPSPRYKLTLSVLIAALLLALTGCSKSSGEQSTAAVERNQLRVRLDKSQAERLLRYYFGGYAGPHGADPFQQGLLTKQEGHFYVRLDSLALRHPQAARRLRKRADENGVNWDELAVFLQETYYQARSLPRTRKKLLQSVDLPQDSSAWFSVEVDGVMTSARRRVRLPEAAIRHALSHYHENDEKLIYPVGTTIIGGHHAKGALTETTVMRKRSDGFWDFFTYGSDGKLAAQTKEAPRALKSPTECVGCHMGTRQFTPEKNFPATSSPGPHGPRRVHVGEAYRDAEVARFFQEHAKRSDMVLGLYNTLFVSRLRAEQRKGNLSAKDKALLDSLKL